jgi:integrase/recombinase XerD
MSQNNYFITNKYSYSKRIYTIYNNYKGYLSQLDLSSETKEWRLKHIRGFLMELDKKNIDFKNITSECVYDYILSIQNLSAKTREHRAVCIRLFLNYLSENGFSTIDGNKTFPKIKTIKESTLPSYYSIDEISKMISSINRKEKNGKRDLCIVLLFSKLGLRTKDVRNIKFENIDWQNNEIQIIQSKTNWLNILPMDNTMRLALIDYIKNDRPKFDSENIFINEKGKIYNDHIFYKIIYRYLKKSKVNTFGKRKGPHSIRHSLAKATLDDNNGINIVSNLLGHTSTKSTKVYLKLNFRELKKISLEVPEWKN